MKKYRVNSMAGLLIEPGQPVKLDAATAQRFIDHIEAKEKTDKKGRAVREPVVKAGAHVVVRPIRLKNGSEIEVDVDLLTRAQLVLLTEEDGDGGRRAAKAAAAANAAAAFNARAEIAAGALDAEVKARAALLLSEKEELDAEDPLDAAVIQWIADSAGDDTSPAA